MRYQWWAGDMKVMSSIGSGETHVRGYCTIIGWCRAGG